MKYVIHSTIIFDTTEYTLTALNNPHVSIKLSNSAGRVLEELVKYRNTDTPVTRAHLFSVVWKTHGLEPSNGNLNQQISLIRKIFTTFGLNGSSIITIPKRGLKLNNQLIIKKIKNETSQNTILSKDIMNNYHTNITSSTFLSFKSYMKYITSLIAMMMVILLIGVVYFHVKQNNIKLYCCKEVDSCNICTFNSMSGPEYNDDNVQHFEII